MEQRKITDLICSALDEPDYKFRINFLLSGLMSEEANDTPEKETTNNELLQDIYDFCNAYSGDKKAYISQISTIIANYLSS